MNDIIEPHYQQDHFPIWFKIAISFVILLTALATIVMSLVGIVVFPIAWQFRQHKTDPNEYGWFMLNLPSWAWQWDNDYDGIVGQKNGKNYSKYPLGSFRGCFHWSVLRNPANNFSRYFIGFDYRDVVLIAQDGNWWIAQTHDGAYFRYKGFGWKIEKFRYADRPWCGFGYRNLNKVK